MCPAFFLKLTSSHDPGNARCFRQWWVVVEWSEFYLKFIFFVFAFIFRSVRKFAKLAWNSLIIVIITLKNNSLGGEWNHFEKLKNEDVSRLTSSFLTKKWWKASCDVLGKIKIRVDFLNDNMHAILHSFSFTCSLPATGHQRSTSQHTNHHPQQQRTCTKRNI